MHIKHAIAAWSVVLGFVAPLSSQAASGLEANPDLYGSCLFGAEAHDAAPRPASSAGNQDLDAYGSVLKDQWPSSIKRHAAVSAFDGNLDAYGSILDGEPSS